MLVRILLVLVSFTSLVAANPIDKDREHNADAVAQQVPDFPLPETFFKNPDTAEAYRDLQYPNQKEADDYFESQGFSEPGLPAQGDVMPSSGTIFEKNRSVPSVDNNLHKPQNPIKSDKHK